MNWISIVWVSQPESYRRQSRGDWFSIRRTLRYPKPFLLFYIISHASEQPSTESSVETGKHFLVGTHTTHSSQWSQMGRNDDRRNSNRINSERQQCSTSPFEFSATARCVRVCVCAIHTYIVYMQNATNFYESPGTIDRQLVHTTSQRSYFKHQLFHFIFTFSLLFFENCSFRFTGEWLLAASNCILCVWYVCGRVWRERERRLIVL